MKTYLFIIHFLIGLHLMSCKKIFPDDKFELKKVSNNSNKLKLNGYYYNGNEKTIFAYYFFYQNGIIYHGGGFLGSNINDLSNLENFIPKQTRNSLNKEYWGLYEINSDKIKFERYYPSSGGPKKSYIRSGKILNDSTFVISQSVRSFSNNVIETNEVYHFKKFLPKPDSTNNFL